MLIGEGSHEEIAVIVVGLHSDVHSLVVARLLSRLGEVLGQELSLLVEVVTSTLEGCVSMCPRHFPFV